MRECEIQSNPTTSSFQSKTLKFLTHSRGYMYVALSNQNKLTTKTRHCCCDRKEAWLRFVMFVSIGVILQVVSLIFIIMVFLPCESEGERSSIKFHLPLL